MARRFDGRTRDRCFIISRYRLLSTCRCAWLSSARACSRPCTPIGATCCATFPSPRREDSNWPSQNSPRLAMAPLLGARYPAAERKRIGFHAVVRFDRHRRQKSSLCCGDIRPLLAEPPSPRANRDFPFPPYFVLQRTAAEPAPESRSSTTVKFSFRVGTITRLGPGARSPSPGGFRQKPVAAVDTEFPP